MISATVLRQKGMKALSEKLGIVDAERFIAIIKREPFDYTEWRQELYKDEPLDTLLQKAAAFRAEQENKK
ncbi:MAG: hypothetical protein LBQ66_07765 [Planctomycetaceae bacterium]|jgi:hypothetical protein|nr:hypothetical protein [Planctomycetaceae bacterium]